MVAVHAFDPSSQGAEAGGAPQIQGQHVFQSEFHTSQSCYTEKPWP